ncbi:MAG: hypothetical protein ACRD4Y_08750, partial [Candidatus Acidiferrales bacterium]
MIPVATAGYTLQRAPAFSIRGKYLSKTSLYQTAAPVPAGLRGESLDSDRLAVPVALLTNFVPPYMLPVLRSLTGSVQRLTVFVSTPMESNRPWNPDWTGIEVVIQKSIARKQRVRYDRGFSMTFERHFPYDSLPQLF